MGFVGKVMENVGGIQYYYIAGLFIFLALFVWIIYRTYKMPKSKLMEYKNSILDNED